MHEIDLGQWFHGNGLRQGLEIRWAGCGFWRLGGAVDRLSIALLSTLLQITLISEISDDLLSVY